MEHLLLIISIVIVMCVVCNKVSSRFGVPMLLVFIALGMFFGTDGVVKIPFDNYNMAMQICSVSLIFIMFYGGFGTNWKEAKPVAVRAIILSSLGTVLTALIVGVFCRYVLKIGMLESFLIGSVISSTDAASVFNILRSKRLNLKYKTASLLELESGSNDPFSYMLTVIVLSLMQKGEASASEFVKMVFLQIFLGLFFGVVISAASSVFLKRFKFSVAGFDAVFMIAVAIASYTIPALAGGNGYLSAYITGIILGNTKFPGKSDLAHFFDGVTGLMQMLLFFLLGLLSFPSQLPSVALTALLIALFLTFVARPLVVFVLLAPFKNSTLAQKLLVSWSGMRGAASIVFAIMTVTSPAVMQHDIFHIVFFIVLFSILVQGSLIPVFARKLKMTDDETNVMKTFNDYTDEVPVQFIRFTIPEFHDWNGKKIREILLPPDSILVLVIRDGEKIIPYGSTVLKEGDTVILGGMSSANTDGLLLREKTLEENDGWAHKRISEIDVGDELIVIIKRAGRIVIPKGSTMLYNDDVLVLTDAGKSKAKTKSYYKKQKAEQQKNDTALPCDCADNNAQTADNTDSDTDGKE